MTKKSKRARQRQKRQLAREHLELDKAKGMVDAPEAGSEGNKTTKEESGSPLISSATASSATASNTPATTSQSQPNGAQDSKSYGKYIVWPFIAVWRLVRWGFLLADHHSGGITALATVAIVALTFFYVGYSKKQWQVAQDTLRISQGAYVAIGRKDGTVAEFVLPHDPTANAGIIIYFQNSGHLPARFNWGLLTPIVTIPQSPDFPKDENQKSQGWFHRRERR